MSDKLVGYIKHYISGLDDNTKKDAIKNILIKASMSSDQHAPIKRANRNGNPLECPYGIFKSRADATRFILENHKEEFLEKFKGFKVPEFTNRLHRVNNSPEQHYIYWSIVTMCRSAKYPAWNFLEIKLKELD
jgi:hypothetical protein